MERQEIGKLRERASPHFAVVCRLGNTESSGAELVEYATSGFYGFDRFILAHEALQV